MSGEGWVRPFSSSGLNEADDDDESFSFQHVKLHALQCFYCSWFVWEVCGGWVAHSPWTHVYLPL